MKAQITAAIALVLNCSIGLAQSQQQANTGWYIGGSLGQANTSFSTRDFSLGDSGISEGRDDKKTAGKILIGHNFNPNWAVEGAYAYLGSPTYTYAGTSATIAPGVAGTGLARIKQDAWAASLKGALPVTPQFDVFGRVGASYNRSDAEFSATTAWGLTKVSSTNNHWNAIAGIGVEYRPQKKLGIRAEYENYGQFGNANNTGRTTPEMWSIGIIFGL